MNAFIERIHSSLKGNQFTLSSEAILKIEIARAFTASGVQFKTETRLDSRNRLDFWCDKGLAIEVKIKGSAKNIFRQCQRYCEFDQVKAILLITTKAMGFPSEIKGKPCYVINLGGSWL